MEEIPIGAGMDSAAGKNGAAALCHGAPTSVAILTVVWFRDFLFVRMVWTGSAPRGQFQDGSYVPAAGDIIFFDWGSDGGVDHVGIVESVSGGTVNTIEGNSGDKVARRSYSIGDSRIYGYGVPQY